MSKYIYLIDAGHGGIIDGVYVTPGKRGNAKPDGTFYAEGVGNRVIRDYLAAGLHGNDIEFHYVTVGQEDVSLPKRVEIINNLCKSYKKPCVLISIHSNAATSVQAHGWEVWTTIGETKSDDIASICFQEAIKVLKKFNISFRKDMKDGDTDKESNFYIIKNSSCPAILTENLFMTNEVECKLLESEEGMKALAQLHLQTILRVEKEIKL